MVVAAALSGNGVFSFPVVRESSLSGAAGEKTP